MRVLAMLVLLTPFVALSAAGSAAGAQETQTPAQPASAVTNDAGQSASADKLAATNVVWVTSNGRYHCPADLWFGRTHDGKYMAEDDARAQGYRHEKGTTCNAQI